VTTNISSIPQKSRRGGLKEAAEYTGLSAWELRTGALSGKYPSMRLGGPNGKFWFDFKLLDQAIERLMLQSSEPEPKLGIIRRIG
jgi:hypothetical protein